MSRHDKVLIEEDQQLETIAGLMEEVRSTYGEEEIQTLTGGSTRWSEDMVIPSGSLSLDMAIGIGGWPRGRIIEMFGPESSGKTTMALHAARAVQRQGGTVAYIDAENALDPNYMRKLGLDLSKLMICQPTYLEKAIDIMNTLMETGKVDLLVVDSIPALKAQDVVEGDADKETRALEARRWSAQLPKMASNAKRSNTTIIMLNQLRDSMSMYGDPISTPGGRAIKFNASVRVSLKKFVEGRKNDGIDYQQVTADLIKNKVGPPFRKAIFYLDPPRPIDWIEDTLIAAIDYNVIHKDERLETDGVFEAKKQWHSMMITAEELDIMIGDDEELVAKKRESGNIFPIDNPDGDEPTHYGVEIYQRGPFEEFMRSFPELIAVLEERVLDRLNEGDLNDTLLDESSE